MKHVNKLCKGRINKIYEANHVIKGIHVILNIVLEKDVRSPGHTGIFGIFIETLSSYLYLILLLEVFVLNVQGVVI